MATKFSGILPSTKNREKIKKDKGSTYVKNEDGKILRTGYFNYYLASDPGKLKTYHFTNWTKSAVLKHEEMLKKSHAHTYIGTVVAKVRNNYYD